MSYVRASIARAARLWRLRWLRVSALIVLGALIIFTAGGFLGVPLLIHHLVTAKIAAALHRQATVGRVRFNPYTLRLDAQALRISEPDGVQLFAEIGRIRLKASWSSLYRLAPVIQELTIEGPTLHAVRAPDQRFNFSDLLQQTQSPPPPQEKAPAARKWRFAISNIRLKNGRVGFDDEAFHEHHTVERIELGVPFIANLPADVEIYVQPMVRMVIDGSPFRVMGMTKPFASVPDSILDLKLNHLELNRIAAYLTRTVPVRIPRGSVSTELQVHFLQPSRGPSVHISGTVQVDELEMRDAADAPLISFKEAKIPLIQADPLNRILILGDIGILGLRSALVRNPGGKTNFTALGAGFGSAQPPPPRPSPPFYLFVRSFDLADSQFNLRDNTTASPVALTLSGVHFALRNFDTNRNAAPVPFQVQAGLGQGSVKMTGTFDLGHSRLTTTATLDKVDLVPLQAWAQPFWAGTLASGTLSGRAQMKAELAGGRLSASMKPGAIALDSVELRAPGDSQKPLQFDHLSIALNQVDLAARRADLKAIRIDRLRIYLRRAPDGRLSVTSFLRPAPAAQPEPAASAPSAGVQSQPPQGPAVQHQPVMSLPGAGNSPASAPGWQYQIGSIAIESVAAEVQDDSGPAPILIQAQPLNIHLKDVSSDFSKSFGVEADAALKPEGEFKVEGTAAINPLAAKMHVTSSRLDLTPADVYVGGRVNAKITRAALSMDGDVEMARVQDTLRITYRGGAAIGKLRVYDKATNQRFLRWDALRASGIDAEIGAGRPRVDIRELLLSDFKTRLILSSEGKLNLRDIAARSKSPQGASAPVKEKTAAQDQPAKPAPPDADINVGRITLEGGAVNYTDNYIKPNYSANLTDIAGTIGSIGTGSSRPAEVDLRGELNSSAPIDITGAINPLASKPFVDIKAKAEGIELTNLSPYSTKYTGYPITKGTLNFDVHYRLEDQRLTATNHLFFSQLTFGRKVNSPNAINLPIAMAVDLLKNPRGEIDLRVPVSGSLDDPQFSVGSLVFKVLSNLIIKVVSSPFSVLASIAGGSHQQLNRVEFPPGQATLTPDAISRLSTLAKAMQARPALRLSISGRVDPDVDRPGLRDAMFERLVKREKLDALRERGESADLSSVTVAPDEYDKYLKLAYKHAKFDKPRNFLGLDKSIPPDQMKALLLANIRITPDNLKVLATNRAVAVRKYLGKQIDPARLAVTAPVIEEDGKRKDKGGRVDLSVE
jgi:hypothetical protein